MLGHGCDRWHNSKSHFRSLPHISLETHLQGLQGTPQVTESARETSPAAKGCWLDTKAAIFEGRHMRQFHFLIHFPPELLFLRLKPTTSPSQHAAECNNRLCAKQKAKKGRQQRAEK